MDIDEKAKEILDRFKGELKSTLDEVINEAYCELLPHAEHDTFCNVSNTTEQVVKNMIAGKFRINDYGNLVVQTGNFDIQVKVTDSFWDDARDNLIKNMPECPKDLKIRALEKEVQQLNNYINNSRGY